MIPDKISIIIVTLNAREIIKQSIESVLNQNYPHLELIVIDGGSTDGTIEILKENKNDITHWVSEPDKGIYDAMNKGIAMARGEWILFLGADDELCKGILNKVFLDGQYSSTDLLYGKVTTGPSFTSLGNATDYQQLIVANIPHQAIFYKKTLLDKLKGYDLRYKILADYDLNLKIFEDPTIKKLYLDKVIATYCSTGISNRTIDYLFFSEKLAYFISQLGLTKTDKRLAKYYFFIGVSMVLKKKYGIGYKNLAHPILYGGRRLHYFLQVGNFMLTLAGFGRKFKSV